MNGDHKPVFWLSGEIKSPPFTPEGRRDAGRLLRRLQVGDSIGMPLSRPMPSIGARCHELRVRDPDHNWRIIYRIDSDAIVVVEVFAKTTRTTPKRIIDGCKATIAAFDRDR